MLKYLVAGFFVQTLTSFDDTLTRIPISATLTKRRKGKIAFSIGNICAVSLAVLIAFLFSGFLGTLPYAQYITSGLIFLLAVAVYLDVLKKRVSEKTEEKIVRPMSNERFFQLMGVGFVVSFIMTLDDIIALAPLFLGNTSSEKLLALLGITIATLLQIFLVIHSSEKIQHFPHKKELAAGSLVTLGVLVILGVL